MPYTRDDLAQLKRDLQAASAGDEYTAFQHRILPDDYDIIGVRMSALRKFAKSIIEQDCRGFLAMDNHDAYEIDMITALVVANAKCDFEERLEHIAHFVPHIDNWAVCDIFCGDLKCAREHQDAFWSFMSPYWRDDREYVLRFPIVMALNHYLNDEYIDRVLGAMLNTNSDAYYVQMALSWAYSYCFVDYADKTLHLFEDRLIKDKWVHNKAIQKAKESYRVAPDIKAKLNTLRQ